MDQFPVDDFTENQTVSNGSNCISVAEIAAKLKRFPNKSCREYTSTKFVPAATMTDFA